jgi:hypothetical protein
MFTGIHKKLLQYKFSHLFSLAVVFGFVFFSGWWLAGTHSAKAAKFVIAPPAGTYKVGDTFDLTVLLNTEGQNVNALEMAFSFPPDKLQLVSPATTNSIIGVYTSAPKFNNTSGRVEIVGGIPNGINVPAGIITKLTFRVRSVGQASIRFLDNSQVLLNDGQGTNVLRDTTGATYKLELPDSTGPIIISDTHPNQDQWYREKNVSLRWESPFGYEGFSYMMSDNPAEVPDEIIDGQDTKISYAGVSDGIHYFHLRELRDGKWSGTSHYSIKIDSTGPAAFPIEISPGSRTTTTKPYIQFSTTDALSGIDRYEIKLVPLTGGVTGQELLFTETNSPYVTQELAKGSYNVIVRAYDNAGNIQETTQKLVITQWAFSFLGDTGLQIGRRVVLPWPAFWALLAMLILGLGYWAWHMRAWHKKAHYVDVQEVLPTHVKQQLTELQQYRERYGKIAVLLIAAVSFWGLIFGGSTPAHAQIQEIAPPVITSYSDHIKDDEIFYVSGRTSFPASDVIIHVQNLFDGQVFSFQTVSDKSGDWFYRHDGFLSGGEYIMWTQSKIGDRISPPGPEARMVVQPVAFRLVGSRITYENLYLTVIAVLAVLLILLMIYIIFHWVAGRRRHRRLKREISHAQDSIRLGFLALRRDLEAELALIRQAHLNESLSEEQAIRQQQLEADLKNIEDLVGKEIGDTKFNLAI